ncbi:MAG: serine hydrolase domain-containing protein, partial [Catalinimonas sp.]
MKTTILGAALLLAGAAAAQTGVPVPQLSSCDQRVERFLNTYDIPGATVAISKDGRLIYNRGFGHADLARREHARPDHLFRIASVSKPITAVAVMKLVEEGRLNLDDKVFGNGGRLADHPYLSQVQTTDARLADITIQHLLEHSAGWDRDRGCTPPGTPPYGWNLNHCDPIGFPLHVTRKYGEANPVRGEVLIRFLMEEGLNFAPGTDYAYSNVGYLVLGEVIAQTTGVTYGNYVRDSVLAPLGICDMHLGRNLPADQHPRESEYEGNGYSAPSSYGTGELVPWEYGGWNLEAMDAHGGWIATARDLTRLMVAVDGFNTVPDLLSAATIDAMTTPSANASFYAKGWSVNANNNWWHTGALDGTASLLVRTFHGYTFAVLLNKRIIDNRSNAFWTAFDALPWRCIADADAFPAFDLFGAPTRSARDLRVASVTNTSASLHWTPGDGAGHL